MMKKNQGIQNELLFVLSKELHVRGEVPESGGLAAESFTMVFPVAFLFLARRCFRARKVERRDAIGLPPLSQRLPCFLGVIYRRSPSSDSHILRSKLLVESVPRTRHTSKSSEDDLLTRCMM